MASKKIFISPERRHNPHGKYWGMEAYEHDVCCEIAALLKPMLEYNGLGVQIAPSDWTLGQRCDYANANSVDYYLCIHTNAAGNGKTEGTATGCECLYYGEVGGASYKANLLVYRQLTELYPSKRGCKNYSQFYENTNTNMVSCYPELVFHDNGKDAQWLVSHKRETAEALCKGVCGYYGIAHTPAPAEDKPADNQQVAQLQQRVAELERENKVLTDSNATLATKIAAAKELASGYLDKLNQLKKILEV